jgi:hypothetical protein
MSFHKKMQQSQKKNPIVLFINERCKSHKIFKNGFQSIILKNESKNKNLITVILIQRFYAGISMEIHAWIKIAQTVFFCIFGHAKK